MDFVRSILRMARFQLLHSRQGINSKRSRAARLRRSDHIHAQTRLTLCFYRGTFSVFTKPVSRLESFVGVLFILIGLLIGPRAAMAQYTSCANYQSAFSTCGTVHATVLRDYPTGVSLSDCYALSVTDSYFVGFDDTNSTGTCYANSNTNVCGNVYRYGYSCPQVATSSPGKTNGKITASNSVGEPINIGTGNVYQRDEDFNVGRWLNFARYYNSDSSAGLDTIGQHWRHSYASHLNYVPGSSNTGTVTITREDGRVATYALAGGVWGNEFDVPDALTEQTDTNGNPTGWTLSRVDTRTTEQFNASGQLISIQDADNLVTVLNYSTTATPTTVAPGPGYLISVVDPQQRAIQFAYTGSGLIKQVIAPDGSIYGYAYDSNNDLQNVNYPDGKIKTYLYDESPNNGGNTALGLLTGILDESSNRYLSYSYNASAQGINNQMADGVASYSVTYNSDGSADVVDPLGTTRHHIFTMVMGVPSTASVNGICESCSSINTWAYSFNGYVSQTKDYNGNVTTYQHDGNGLESDRVEASGGSAQRTIQTTWKDTFNVPVVGSTTTCIGTLMQLQGVISRATR
jgi:YD repeat-containing protein